MPRKRAIPAAVLHNSASNVPLTRLGAIRELREVAQAALNETFDLLELEQVRTARSRAGTPASWRDIGIRLRISHTQAQRRYAGRL
jgi:hypothetical protein